MCFSPITLMFYFTEDDEHDQTLPSGSSHEPAPDVAFGLPLTTEGGVLSEQQRLIQTGQLTPFGGRVDEVKPSSSQLELIPPSDEILSSNTVGTDPGPSSGLSSLMKQEASISGQESLKESEKSVPSIQLCSDSFDGLFSDPAVRMDHRDVTKNRKRKGRAGSESRSATSSLQGEINSSVSMSDSKSSSDIIEPNMENEDLEYDGWMPTISDLEGSDSDHHSTESEYYTDEELGRVGFKKEKRKKKKLRDLSSDELEFDEVEERHTGRGKKGKGWGKKRRRSRREPKKFQDDGDEELFRLRIQ